jgi:hypothetical protein
MAKGDRPDYRVMYPVEEYVQKNGQKADKVTRWHRHGSAWLNEKGMITIVLDIGMELRYPSKTQLVLVDNNDDNAREPGEEG